MKKLVRGGDPKTKFLLLFLSTVRPSVRPKKNSPDFAPPSDLRRPTWGQSYTVGPILYDVYTLGQNTLGEIKVYWIDPTVLAPGRTSDQTNANRVE